jgi:hypothetical protein
MKSELKARSILKKIFFSIHNQQANFTQTWYKSSLGQKRINKCVNEGPGFHPRGDNCKNVNMG